MADLWQPLDGHILMHGGRGLESLTARQGLNVLSAWAPTVGVSLDVPEQTPTPDVNSSDHLLAMWGEGDVIFTGGGDLDE